MPSPVRPVVFIGSSFEGLPVAQALQINLDHCAEVILWSQGVFGLSEGSLESLVNRLEDFDFAILIVTPDDLTLSRATQSQSPRDNVVFELGLFIGALGRRRSFIVCDRTTAIKLPSDLAGVTRATYQPPSTGSLQSALGACAASIQASIQAQDRRSRPEAGSAAQITNSLVSVMGSSNWPMFFADPNRVVLQVNSSLAELFDMTVEDFRNKPIWPFIEYLSLLVPSDRRAAFLERQLNLQRKFDTKHHPHCDECEYLDTTHYPTSNRWRGRFKLWIHADRIIHNAQEVGYFVIYHLESVDQIPKLA